MKYQTIPVIVLLAVMVLPACVGVIAGDSKLEKAAAAITDIASECLLGVRDRDISYSRSANCTTRLNEAVDAYISAGGFAKTYNEESTVPMHAYKALWGQKLAWSALAWSNGAYRDEPPVFSVW